eukprot:TRINITY_DN100157_c0_g1_i1.p1 TRINITY_DN100157_c0_g1~~TRINITY_DN100157_c0_g1_i1.p1  ORF type:complete len:212 (-),score=19.35 TRINITY_DN100157_c0_g1_i1:17-652(-)
MLQTLQTWQDRTDFSMTLALPFASLAQSFVYGATYFLRLLTWARRLRWRVPSLSEVDAADELGCSHHELLLDFMVDSGTRVPYTQDDECILRDVAPRGPCTSWMTDFKTWMSSLRHFEHLTGKTLFAGTTTVVRTTAGFKIDSESGINQRPQLCQPVHVLGSIREGIRFHEPLSLQPDFSTTLQPLYTSFTVRPAKSTRLLAFDAFVLDKK